MYNLKVYTVAMSILSKCFTVSINRTVQSKYESSKQLSKRTALRQGLLYTGHELDFWPIQLVGNVSKVTTVH